MINERIAQVLRTGWITKNPYPVRHRFHDYEMIKFIQDSEIPNFNTLSERNDFKNLGKWIFDNRKDILNEKIPYSKSGDIMDAGYPLEYKNENYQNKKE